MHEALFYEKLDKNKVKCNLCPRECIINNAKHGFCNVRKNINGILFSIAYGNPASIAIDPIEKKPLFHFLPGSSSLSIGTVGCNLTCQHCQNWEIARARPEDFPFQDINPKEIIDMAKKRNCQSISYTYNEPTIFYEYALDTSKLAHKSNIKNVTVSNGYINQKPLNNLYKFIDGTNIDLKGFNERFYRKVCSADLEYVLKSLKAIKKLGVWLEVTNLIIPTQNDNLDEIRQMCSWIKENLGSIPLHFTAFYPCYRMLDLPKTSIDILKKAKEIALDYLNYVYLGNTHIRGSEDTVCPKCKKILILRDFFSVTQNNIKKGICECGEKIPGIWHDS